MALLDTIPGVEDFIRGRVRQRATHKEISNELKVVYPGVSRGLSVRRFCQANDIHAYSRLSDVELDKVVKTSAYKVSSTYSTCIKQFK